jgi:hypothetical protein
MPRPRVRVKVEGVEAVAAKLKNPRLVEAPLLAIMEEATRVGQKASVLAIDGGTGTAVRSIGRNVGIDRRGSTVYSAMLKATVISIDRGRRPGDRVSIRKLERWARAVGYSGNLRALQELIRTGGTKGKKFLLAGRKAVEDAMPDLTRDWERGVEREWRR